MLQDIGSPRGIAHDLANKYWSTICSNAIRAAINLGGNYNAGEVVVGEHVFDNNCRLSWIVAATGIDPLQISIYTEFSAASGGIVSGRNVIYLTDSGAIDSTVTPADKKRKYSWSTEVTVGIPNTKWVNKLRVISDNF